jgi:hypothetical protein
MDECVHTTQLVTRQESEAITLPFFAEKVMKYDNAVVSELIHTNYDKKLLTMLMEVNTLFQVKYSRLFSLVSLETEHNASLYGNIFNFQEDNVRVGNLGNWC